MPGSGRRRKAENNRAVSRRDLDATVPVLTMAQALAARGVELAVGDLDELAQFALEGIRNEDFVIMIDRQSMEAQLNDRAAKLARGECPIVLEHMGLS